MMKSLHPMAKPKQKKLKHPMLKIENLHAEVSGTPILKGLSLELTAGEIHAVMGPNGAGKSTLAYVLGGRDGYEVTQGSVIYQGKDLLEMDPRSPVCPMFSFCVLHSMHNVLHAAKSSFRAASF